MNPARFLHTVQVERVSQTPVNGLPSGQPATVYASVQCLLEPGPGKPVVSAAGEMYFQGARLSWGAETILPNDRITVLTPATWAGKKFSVADVRDYTMRPWAPYQTAMLEQRSST